MAAAVAVTAAYFIAISLFSLVYNYNCASAAELRACGNETAAAADVSSSQGINVFAFVPVHTSKGETSAVTEAGAAAGAAAGGGGAAAEIRHLSAAINVSSFVPVQTDPLPRLFCSTT